jgi:membrane associated rhomboid family serine protease
VSTPQPGVPAPKGRKERRRDELINTGLSRALKPSSASGAGVIVLASLALLWVIVVVNALLDHRLLRFGIKPRDVSGLWGIVLSPFLHANAGHLLANSVPFAILGWLMLTSGLRYFFLVTGTVMVVAGIVDWLLGPSNTVIVGASGVIFGWFGYVLARAWFGRKLKWIAIAVAVAAVFSTMFTGLLPRIGSNVFWGGHVAGFIVGVLIAGVLHRRPKRATPVSGLLPSPSNPASSL